MTGIDAIGRPAAPRMTRRGRAGGAFALPPESAPEAAMPEDTSAPVSAASVGGLLGLQEQMAGGLLAPAVRDREARRHGQALLSALADLQLIMVGPQNVPGVAIATLSRLADRLTALTSAVPVAADPALGAVVTAIALRARVELARRQPGGKAPENRQNPSMSAY